MSASKAKYPLKSTRKFIQCPLYGAKVHIHIGTDYDKTCDSLSIQREKRDEFDRPAIGTVLGMPSGVLLVWIGKHKSMDDLDETILHETEHLVFKILTDIGMSYTHETMEAFTYYHEYWYKFIRQLTRTK